MSKLDQLRAMREANYAAGQARTAAANAAEKPKPQPGQKPVVRRGRKKRR